MADNKQMTLTADEAEAIRQLRRTPEERKADRATRRQAWLDAMTTQQREAYDAMRAMAPTDRTALQLAQRRQSIDAKLAKPAMVSALARLSSQGLIE